MNDDTELVDGFDDKDDIVIAGLTRSAVHARFLAVRVAACLIWCSGKLIVSVRSRNKTYPLHLDYSAAGHVCTGETYETGASRELQEELGISCKLHALFKMAMPYHNKAIVRKFHQIYWGHCDNPPTPNPLEIDNVLLFDKSNLVYALDSERYQFTPAFRKATEMLLKLDHPAWLKNGGSAAQP